MKEEIVATGRRKTAVASVRVRPGSGKVNINGRAFEDYLPRDILRNALLLPFAKLNGNGNHDLVIRVKGGGVPAQVDAMRLGIARALIQSDETLQGDFKEKGYLTRDPRQKERKKYGQPGARKRFQFSKR